MEESNFWGFCWIVSTRAFEVEFVWGLGPGVVEVECVLGLGPRVFEVQRVSGSGPRVREVKGFGGAHKAIEGSSDCVQCPVNARCITCRARCV